METRARLLLVLVSLGFMMIQFSPPGLKDSFGVNEASRVGVFLVVMMSTLLAGAGVSTQPSFRSNKGLHESRLFTLSLPVSRLRLLAVRAGLGWVEMAAVIAVMCGCFWTLFPVLREATTPEQMFMHATSLVVCATGLYGAAVLVNSLLDDPWRVPGMAIALGALWLLFNYTPLPESVDIFRAMLDRSPLFGFGMPWAAMALALGLASLTLFGALRVAQSREF